MITKGNRVKVVDGEHAGQCGRFLDAEMIGLALVASIELKDGSVIHVRGSALERLI